MNYLRVKNWEQFQHYSKRNPPWIKLHNEILHSRTWVGLDDENKALAVAIMLLASRFNNSIPCDPVYIQRVAYLQKLPDLDKLFEIDFIEEITTETETETEHTSKVLASASMEIPDWIDIEVWTEFEKHRKEIRAKLTPTATKRLLVNLDEHRQKGVDPNEALRESIRNQWRGVFPERLLEKINGKPNGTGQTAIPETKHQQRERRNREAIERADRRLAELEAAKNYGSHVAPAG